MSTLFALRSTKFSISRKHLFFLIAILIAVLALPLGVFLSMLHPAPSVKSLQAVAPTNDVNSLDPVSYVNPFIGTDASATDRKAIGGFAGGNVFPGASFPHGMVQWSPDTTNAPGGYRYPHAKIHGFSLTHFSGRGCDAYQDIPFMPTLGPLSTSPADPFTYASHFSHEHETARPGFYSVLLDDRSIKVSLTVTARSGFGQFIYPHSKDAVMLINVGGSARENADTGTQVQVIGSNQVVGSATSGHFCGSKNMYTVYFAANFEQPFVHFGTWNGPFITPDSRSSSGAHAGAYLSFDTTQRQTIQVKVGLSFVSVANALTNLHSEDTSWNFASVRSNAGDAWNTYLKHIRVGGGTKNQKIIFYTALYHTLFHPNVFSDVNGEYIGFDQRVHKAVGYTQYENFPGWDMYRSLVPLLAILDPKAVGDMLQSLVADAEQGGGGMPRWEVANDNSGGMVGDSPDVVVSTSYAFGVRNFDTQAALRAMDFGAAQPDAHSSSYLTREGLRDYLQLGYVSTRNSGSGAITLEYATDDFALAQYAKALGNTELYTTYMQRAQNWKNLFNTDTGYIEPRNPDGSFIANYNPTSETGFVESDGLQYTWLVPFDLPGLFAGMGGNANVVQRLDAHFARLNDGPTSRYAFMGNEPEFEVPWEYDFAGAPSHTQEVVRRIETQLFRSGPDGLPGNDDGGAMSSWYVFAAMGLYPEVPGVAGFALGSPLFPVITVDLGNGHQLQINGRGASENTPYVQHLTVNGKLYTNSWLPFTAIQNGATLDFTLGSKPPVGA